MAHGHFMDRCECGIILRQCRCLDPAKTVNVIRPCVHTGPIGMAHPEPVEDEVAAESALVKLDPEIVAPVAAKWAELFPATPLRIAVNERYIGEGMMVGVCGLCCTLIWPGADAARKHVEGFHGGTLVE